MVSFTISVGPGLVSMSHEAPNITRAKYSNTGVFFSKIDFHGELDLHTVYIVADT